MFLHRADLVDRFLRAGLFIFPDLIGGAVPFRVSVLCVPGILTFCEAVIMMIVVTSLHILECVGQLIFIFFVCERPVAVVAIPIDILSCPFSVDVFAVFQIELAVIVFGIIGAVFSGAPIVSCQFHQQSFLLLPL